MAVGVARLRRRKRAASMARYPAGPSAVERRHAAAFERGGDSIVRRGRARVMVNGPLAGVDGAALRKELVRCATLAASSHNTQCWTFAVEAQAMVIRPDSSRRCPVVDPDDHHMYVSLGCAAENLVQAALAHGLSAQPVFDAARDELRVALAPTAAVRSPLFDALGERQCTRGPYDGKSLGADDLRLLADAGKGSGVRLLLLTDRAAIDPVLDVIVRANTAQLNDPAFVRELGAWIRFNGRDAARSGDGLWAACTGNPSLPAWLGRRLLPWVLSPKAENAKLVAQVRSSAGIAVFVGPAADKASWIEVGRAYERFALQATVLDIRHAHLNQPVEVAALRPGFATLLGLPGQRPDLVLRFGRGPKLPRSKRRSVDAVIV